MNKTALITGINGQDGSYLAEFLLEKEYDVWGILKRNSVSENQTSRIDHIRPQLNLQYADMTDMASLIRVVSDCQPDEVYNLAAQSHVRISFDQPIYTANTVGMGTLNLLETMRLIKKDARIYQASSSEMFGNNIDGDGYQRESTPLQPVSPYGCAKVFAHNLCHNYRNAYDMFISCGILFNHESPRRGSNFVTSKVVKEALRIHICDTTELRIGNTAATRDWGHAKDYVKAMWMMLQHDKPDDFVCATGISHSVQDLIDYVFEKLMLKQDNYIVVDPKYFRAEELKDLKGDSTKLRETLGWKPDYTFELMIDEMVDHWRQQLQRIH